MIFNFTKRQDKVESVKKQQKTISGFDWLTVEFVQSAIIYNY